MFSLILGSAVCTLIAGAIFLTWGLSVYEVRGSSKIIAMTTTVWNCRTAETGNRGQVACTVTEVYWSQYQLQCVVQQNGRYI